MNGFNLLMLVGIGLAVIGAGKWWLRRWETIVEPDHPQFVDPERAKYLAIDTSKDVLVATAYPFPTDQQLRYDVGDAHPVLPVEVHETGGSVVPEPCVLLEGGGTMPKAQFDWHEDNRCDAGNPPAVLRDENDDPVVVGIAPHPWATYEQTYRTDAEAAHPALVQEVSELLTAEPFPQPEASGKAPDVLPYPIEQAFVADVALAHPLLAERDHAEAKAAAMAKIEALAKERDYYKREWEATNQRLAGALQEGREVRNLQALLDTQQLMLNGHVGKIKEQEVTIRTLIDDKGKLIAMHKAEKDEAYRQRNMLAAALATAVGGGKAKTSIPGWDAAWHGCIYIELPTGQISYHYHDSMADALKHLPRYRRKWDGHDDAVKNERIGEFIANYLPARY